MDKIINCDTVSGNLVFLFIYCKIRYLDWAYCFLLSENDLLEIEGMDDTPNFLETEGLDDIQLELIDGDKSGSSWLVVCDIFICQKFSESESEIFWECSGRRKYGCLFRIGTMIDDDGSLSLSYMYKLSVHDCEQDKMGPIMQKFRSKLKYKMSTD